MSAQSKGGSGQQRSRSNTSSSRKKGPPKRLVNTLRKQLEAEREQLLSEIERLDADFSDESWKEQRSDDEAYTGSAIFERERTMSLAQNARAMLRKIDAALERIEAGNFGQCLNCGEAIDPERLEALPQAELCLSCRTEAERSAR